MPVKFGTCSAISIKQRPMRPEYQPEDYAISKAMQEYWTNFAKTGDPNGNELPAWLKYQSSTGQFLEFTDGGPVVSSGLRRAQCEVFAKALKQKTTEAATGTR